MRYSYIRSMLNLCYQNLQLEQVTRSLPDKWLITGEMMSNLEQGGNWKTTLSRTWISEVADGL